MRFLPKSTKPSFPTLFSITALTAGQLFISNALADSAADQAAAEAPEEMIISSLRLATPIKEAGTSITTITQEQLDQLGVDFVLDALTLSPGVTVNQNGAFGGAASVRIRGASSEQTLVLINGIPVNDPTSPGGGFNFARLDTENIERIEILRGPQSTLWGTDAIGGVVAITTKRPQAGASGNAFMEFGSFNTWRGGVSGSVAGDMGDLRLAATGLTSDGISKADEDNGNDEEDSFKSGTLSATGGLNLANDIRLDGSFLWTRADAEFDSFSGEAQGAVADGDELSETEEIAANVSLLVPLWDGRLENLLVVGYSSIDRRNLTNGAESFRADGERLILRYQGTFNVADNQRLLFGAERDSAKSRGASNVDDSAINGFFGVYEIEPLEGLTLSGGVRLDDQERFGSNTTFRAAAAYQVSDEMTLRGSWGEGFKAPTIFQTTFFCCGAEAPNTDLRPERSKGFDLGVDFASDDGRKSLSVTYFNQDIEDQINFSFAVGGYENIASVDSQGVEISGSIAPISWLTLGADYTFMDVEDQDSERLVRLPRNTANLSATLTPNEAISATIFARYNGSEEDRRGIVDDWVRVDVSAQYRFSESLEAFARVENLLDADYQQILGYGTPGISGSIGVRLRL